MDKQRAEGQNPILYMDYPDLDIIRVDDTYYMITTTMHFMPGGEILRSYDLIHWEVASYVYEALEETPGQCLEDGVGIYGKGMWAASLRYHEGVFYVCFVANDTGKTYLYRATQIEGPWEKSEIQGFYHDCSLLFDEGRSYLVYGNKEIWLTELNADLSAPREGGLHRCLVVDEAAKRLGFEGSHIYKIGGYYYLFMIHWYEDGGQPGRPGVGIRTQACYYSDALTGTFSGGDVLADDLGFFHQGVAQGGIVDTPEGDWYSMLFQDHGAVGRIPVLVPMTLTPGALPRFGMEGKVPLRLQTRSTRPEASYAPLWGTKLLERGRLASYWQWNHIPNLSRVCLKENHLTVTTHQVVSEPTLARNMLTQRLVGPTTTVTVRVDGSDLGEGDYCGLVALQYEYGLAALTKCENHFYVVLWEKYISWQLQEDVLLCEKCHDGSFVCLRETVRIPWEKSCITLQMQADFTDMKDEIQFFVEKDKGFVPLGGVHKVHFCLEHFAGVRLGLSVFSTKQSGGTGVFEPLQMVAEEVSG